MIDIGLLDKYIQRVNNRIRNIEFQIEINHFISIFESCMNNEGWTIITSVPDGADFIYTVEYKNAIQYNLGHDAFDEVFLNNIREYGITVSDEGIIIDINLENVKKNRHLLNCNELGLL